MNTYFPVVDRGFLYYRSKARGEPCKRGETAKRTGCIPRSKTPKSSGSKPSSTTSKTPKPKKQSVKKPTADEAFAYLDGLKGQIANSTDEIINYLVGMTVAELSKVKKKVGVRGGGRRKDSIIMDLVRNKLSTDTEDNVSDGFQVDDVEARKLITQAILKSSRGKEGIRVRLADVHDNLGGALPKDQIDRNLLQLEREGLLSLFKLDNPYEIRQRDRDTVLHTPAGYPRHILYYGGRGS